MTSPFWKALHAAQGELDRLTPGRKSTVREHQHRGLARTQIIPELYRGGRATTSINNKKSGSTASTDRPAAAARHAEGEERGADGHQ